MSWVLREQVNVLWDDASDQDASTGGGKCARVVADGAKGEQCYPCGQTLHRS